MVSQDNNGCVQQETSVYPCRGRGGIDLDLSISSIHMKTKRLFKNFSLNPIVKWYTWNITA